MAKRRRKWKSSKSRANSSEPSFLGKVIKVAFAVWRMKGRWAIFVDGKADPRRFPDWRQLDLAIRGELSLIPYDTRVVCKRVTTKPSFGECLRWAFKRCR